MARSLSVVEPRGHRLSCGPGAVSYGFEQILREFGSDVLAGDFSIRSRIVRMQVSAWLDSKCQEVMGKRRSRSVEDGIRQAIWEFLKKTEEQKSEIRQVLSEWIAKSVDQKRTFAENLIKHI